jgi:RHS repeat-associated protein
VNTVSLYDERNQLTSAVHHSATGDLLLTAIYKYDAFGNRIEKDVSIRDPITGQTTLTVTQFALDGWKASGGHLVGNENWDVWADVIQTGPTTTNLVSRYLRGDAVDQLFARVDTAGSLTPFWYLTDNLGSIRNMVDNSGNTADTVSYDAFGTVNPGETGAGSRGRYGWTGREMDVETGLQYNRARYYDSSTGRWLSQDPLGFDAGDSNLYRYVKNGPTMATDPSGTWRWEIDSSGKIIAISEAGDSLGTLISQGYSKEMIVKIAGSGDLAKVLDRGTKLDISSLFPPALQKMIKDQQNTPTIGVPIGLSASVYRLPLGLLPQGLINQFQGPKLGSGQCYSFVALFKGIKAPPFKPSSWTDYLKIPWVIISNTIATIIRQYNPANFSVSGTSNEGGKFGDLNAPGATPGTYLHIAGNLKPGVVVVPEQGLEKYITAGKQTANPMFGATVVFKDADNVFATIVHCGIVLGKSKNGDIMIIQKQNAFKTIVITTPRFWKTFFPTYWQQ